MFLFFFYVVENSVRFIAVFMMHHAFLTSFVTSSVHNAFIAEYIISPDKQTPLSYFRSFFSSQLRLIKGYNKSNSFTPHYYAHK